MIEVGFEAARLNGKQYEILLQAKEKFGGRITESRKHGLRLMKGFGLNPVLGFKPQTVTLIPLSSGYEIAAAQLNAAQTISPASQCRRNWRRRTEPYSSSHSMAA